ncbi:antibiotic biosynthesis monooxygenase [Ktedonobacteria bacterium brp13]|nr:antibiotic biosynthesis monooxygenase [Ktedonobacteria bacterium brp13]
MVTEIAVFTAIPGKEEELGHGIIKGIEAIRQHPGCISANATRCVEQPGRFMLTAVWSSLEAHMNDFRNSPNFAEWRSHVNGRFEGQPELFHYQAF